MTRLSYVVTEFLSFFKLHKVEHKVLTQDLLKRWYFTWMSVVFQDIAVHAVTSSGTVSAHALSAQEKLD